MTKHSKTDVKRTLEKMIMPLKVIHFKKEKKILNTQEFVNMSAYYPAPSLAALW